MLVQVYVSLKQAMAAANNQLIVKIVQYSIQHQEVELKYNITQ